MVKPSYIANILSGITLFVAIYFLYNELYIKKTQLSGIPLVNLMLFISTSISLHGILHIMAEKYYDFNPFENGKLYY